MKIVVAPDSFKEALPALEAARAMARGLKRACPEVEIELVPMADGGEGTVQALVDATGGEIVRCPATGPLGEPAPAFFGVLGDKRTAVIEMAAASGLELVPFARRDPRRTTTRGTGELIRAALDRGLEQIILGVGGSATVDGGTGAAAALGARFLDEEGNPLPEGGGALVRLARIDLAHRDPRLLRARLRVACDVKNPLVGPQGAARVYGPQKGADPAAVELLEQGLVRLAEVAEGAGLPAIRERPGAGAAGGLAGGAVAFLGGTLEPGVELVLEANRLAQRLAGAALVLTGEGALDRQSAYGKVVAGVAGAARRAGVPAIVLAGTLGEGFAAVRECGVSACFSLLDRPRSLPEAMGRTAELLERAAEELLRLFLSGRRAAG